ncbi:MAG: sigma-70 family RNA polymerase sigma factor [Caldilineaceae bacterium]
MPTDDCSKRQASCQLLVQRLIAQYGWTLLSAEALVEQTLHSLPANPTLVTLQKSVIDCYTIELYAACHQSIDPVRREQGYRELYRILLGSARKWRPDQAVTAEERAQRALELVFEQIERCQSSTTFLAFALYKLRQAFTEADRAMVESATSLDEATEHGELARQATAAWQAVEIQREHHEIIQAALATLADERTKQVIVLKFLEGWSDQEIGRQLAITENHVRVLRNRGLAQLRKQQQLIDSAESYDSGVKNLAGRASL